MQVDQRFADRVNNSRFSNQQWGLIMTAAEFDIQNPADPEEATMVADTEKLEHVIPELDNIPEGMGAPSGGGQSGRRDTSGLLGKLTGLFAGGDDGGGEAEQEVAARKLVEEYATELERYLHEEGRWEELCASAAAEQS